MIKVVVTGATGFIGHHLVRELKKRGYWVRAAGTVYNKYVNEADEFILGNLVNFNDCYKAVSDVDHVFHLAASIGGIKFISENESVIMNNNAIMDMNMIDASVGSKVNKFFYSSSACVYPFYATNSFNPKPIAEDMAYPANPDNGYGWEKVFMEQTLFRYQNENKIDTKVARFFSTYGPEMKYVGEDVKSLIALCRKIVEAKDEIEIWGPGTQLRAFCYIEDVVDGIIKLMESEYHGPYNIGNAESITINKLAQLIIDISGKNLTIKNVPGTVGVKGRRCNSYLANRDLKWERKTSLYSGVKKTYEWVKGEIEK